MNILATIGIAALLQARGTAVSGSIRSGKKSMSPADTVAVWDAAQGTLLPPKADK